MKHLWGNDVNTGLENVINDESLERFSKMACEMDSSLSASSAQPKTIEHTDSSSKSLNDYFLKNLIFKQILLQMLILLLQILHHQFLHHYNLQSFLFFFFFVQLEFYNFFLFA